MVAGPIRIELIRHGEVHNPQKILYGRLPGFRLSEKGWEQAAAAGRRLNGATLDAVFSSPMLRARQTTRQILEQIGQPTFRISSLINEVYSCFEGRPGSEIDARKGDVYTGAADCFEQPGDIVTRSRKFIARMRKLYSGGRVAAVTHGDVITFMVLWAKRFELTPRNKTRLIDAGYPDAYPAHASITTLTYQTSSPDERPKIQYNKP